MQINVASWNIWVFGGHDYKGIAKFIKKNNVEIIGLQEATINYDKPKNQNITEEIARELNYNYFFDPITDARPKHNFIFGNAVISKFPIAAVKSYNLNPSSIKSDGTFMTERRKIIHSKIDLGKNKSLNFLTAHLQYSKKFKTNYIKKAEVDTIISVVSGLKKPIVLTGDFNLTPESREIKRMGNVLKRIGGNKPTWTMYPFEAYGWHEDRLKYRLDNIFISKGMSYKDFKVGKSKISDHLPIIAKVDLK